MSKGFLGLGIVAGAIAAALCLIVESIVPGAILHFAAGWDFVNSVLLAAAVQLGLLILFVLAAAGFGLAASK